MGGKVTHRPLVAGDYDLMRLVNNKQLEPVHQKVPYIAHQRFSLLDRRDKDRRRLGCQPVVGDAPVRPSVEASDGHLLAAELSGEFGFHFPCKCARGNEVKRQTRRIAETCRG